MNATSSMPACWAGAQQPPAFQLESTPAGATTMNRCLTTAADHLAFAMAMAGVSVRPWITTTTGSLSPAAMSGGATIVQLRSPMGKGAGMAAHPEYTAPAASELGFEVVDAPSREDGVVVEPPTANEVDGVGPTAVPDVPELTTAAAISATTRTASAIDTPNHGPRPFAADGSRSC